MSKRKYDKEKVFEELIWKAYSQDENYDKLRHKLIRVKNIMSDSHESFRNMNVKKQFDYCLTICIIAVHSSHKDISGISIFSPRKNEVFEYAIDEGYVAPIPIELSEMLLLPLPDRKLKRKI